MFKFESKWINHVDCAQVIKNNWFSSQPGSALFTWNIINSSKLELSRDKARLSNMPCPLNINLPTPGWGDQRNGNPSLPWGNVPSSTVKDQLAGYRVIRDSFVPSLIQRRQTQPTVEIVDGGGALGEFRRRYQFIFLESDCLWYMKKRNKTVQFWCRPHYNHPNRSENAKKFC